MAPADVVRFSRPDDGAQPDTPAAGSFFASPARIMLWAFLGTVCMLFIGFTSAYIVRRGSADWQPLQPPSLLYANTTLLLLSSLTLEIARRRLAAWRLVEVRRFVDMTGVMGVAFVVGQVMAWRQLAATGIFLATNPHSSFFYLLTGLHALHLCGALAWLVLVAYRARRMAYTPGEDGLALFATFWHFLAGLWLYLLLLLFVF